MGSKQLLHRVITYLSTDLKRWCVEQAMADEKSLTDWIRHRLSVMRATEEHDPDFIED